MGTAQPTTPPRLVTPKVSNQVPLQRMSQLAEAGSQEDDWTGITDAALRRKRQNRLNVRAYRKRKAQQAQEGRLDIVSTHAELCTPCWSEHHQAVIKLPASRAWRSHKEELIYTTANVRQPRGIIFPLSSDHLITLLQYNALRGCLANRELLSRFEPAFPPHQDCSSVALHVMPDLDATSLQSLPPALRPTFLQRTIPHEPWIDIIPHPQFRDNLIRAIETFDEDELWSDTIGGLFEGFSEIEQRGIILWSPPWDVHGWEISEDFWRKWGWLLKGCPDALDATNRWRAVRGDDRIDFVT